MPKFNDTTVQREAEDFSNNIFRLLETIGLTKSELAKEISVSEQTIGRWINHSDDSQFPAFIIKLFCESHDDRIQKFGLSLVKYFTNDAGFSVTRNISEFQIDGDLSEEVGESIKQLGPLWEGKDIPVDRADELLDRCDIILSAVFAMKREINNKVQQGK